MRLIKVIDRRITTSWSGDWVYLGSNYLEMRKKEKMLSGSRISLRSYVVTNAELERQAFLRWIEDQGGANEGSIFWWMNHIRGRNNAYSNLYIHWVQIVALRQWLIDVG